MNKIGIIGCGWLGFPLAKFLINQGFTVIGTTTNENKLTQLKAAGITPLHLIINDGLKCDNIDLIKSCDCLIVNFPPKRVDNITELYVKQNQMLIDNITSSNIKHIIFISSTSVYSDNANICKEQDKIQPDKKSGKALKFVEEMYLEQANFDTTILRVAGLIGYDRNPANFMSGKTNVPNGNAPVNLVHRDDCIQIIYKIINKNKRNAIYNVCADKHPTRKEFYILAAKKFNVALPTFALEKEKKHKIVDNSKLKNNLAYEFIYPDPLKYIILKSENKADIE